MLFGKNNPGDKLPVTVVCHVGQVSMYAEQNRGSGVSGRGQGNNNITQGYVDEPGFPLYSFSHGLSYTSFEISDCGVLLYFTTDVCRHPSESTVTTDTL